MCIRDRITTSNRINNIVSSSTSGSGYYMQSGDSGFSTNSDWSTVAKGDPNEAIYITRLTKLATKATALTVSFALVDILTLLSQSTTRLFLLDQLVI